MKRSIVTILFVLIFLSGCAPAAAPTTVPIAAAPSNSAARPAAPTSAYQGAFMATATAAPAAELPLAVPTMAQMPYAEATRAPSPWEQPQNHDNPYPIQAVQPGMTDTRRDHLSTFALDVDTASYTQAKQAIESGSLPAAGSTRVEEFVNFFNQDYPTPQGVAFGVYADGAPSPFDRDNTLLLRFGVQGYRENEAYRQARNLTLVIDVSGSMQESGKLELVKQTIQTLLTRLDRRDVIAVVAYTTTAWVVLDPTSAADSQRIMDAVNALYPMDTTNIQDGLTLGYQMADRIFRQSAYNRVILFTDGVANEGDTSPEGMLNSVRDYAGKNITLTALGVGMGEYNDSLLEKLADNGNGNYAYINNLDEARRLFIEKLAGTLDVIALNAKVQVDFNPDVVRDYRQLGYEDRAIADQNFRNDAVAAGEIGAGISSTALYQVHLRPGAQGRLATVQLRWEDSKSHEVKEINGNFNTWDLNGSFEASPARYKLDVAAAYFAGLLRGNAWASSATWDAIDRTAWQVSSQLQEDQDVTDFAALVNQARGMVDR